MISGPIVTVLFIENSKISDSGTGHEHSMKTPASVNPISESTWCIVSLSATVSVEKTKIDVDLNTSPR